MIGAAGRRPCLGDWLWIRAWSRPVLPLMAAPNAVRSGTFGCDRRDPATL